MYSSTSASIYSPSSLQRSRQWTKRVHENCAPSPHQISSAASHSSHVHILAQASQEIPPEAIQYAPPLSAYSADQCGPSLAYAEYNRALQMSALTGVKGGGPKLTPQIQKKLASLRKIRNTGYNTLVPIGINKTMREIDDEARLVHDDNNNETAGVQVENSIIAGTSVGNDTANVSSGNISSGNGSLGNGSLGNGPSGNNTFGQATGPVADLSVLFPEADLDARVHIVESDSDDILDTTELSVSDAASRSNSHTPDAYMAEDVEYQDDHSLVQETATGQRTVSDSHASVSTRTFASSTMHSGPSDSTFTTHTFNSRTCEDSDVDMTLEYE